MKTQPKVLDFCKFIERKVVREKYSQFRETISAASLALADAKSFLVLQNLNNVKSNDGSQYDLAQLCLHDLESLRIQLEQISENIKITKSKAKVLPFRSRIKAA
jgi:hypothetical protein